MLERLLPEPPGTAPVWPDGDALADALRLVAGLLDSPLPPELARRHTELNWDT